MSCEESSEIDWSSSTIATCPDNTYCVTPSGECIPQGSTKSGLNTGGDDNIAYCVSIVLR